MYALHYIDIVSFGGRFYPKPLTIKRAYKPFVDTLNSSVSLQGNDPIGFKLELAKERKNTKIVLSDTRQTVIG